MTMMLSPQHQERLKGMLKEKPLEDGEVRRVEWTGEQYISLEETEVSSQKFTYLYKVRIGGVVYAFYAKNTIKAANTA